MMYVFMFGDAAVVVFVRRCVTAAELTFAAFCVSAVFSERSAILHCVLSSSATVIRNKVELTPEGIISGSAHTHTHTLWT